MSELVKSILVLLLRVAAERLERGGQFLTTETLRGEVNNLVNELLHSPWFQGEFNRLQFLRTGPHPAADKEPTGLETIPWWKGGIHPPEDE